MSQADAIRSIWGRGRVTQVLPRGGRLPRRVRLGALGRISAARSRLAVVSQRLRARAGRRFQIVDRLHAVELTFQSIELRSQLGDRAPMAQVIAIEVTEDFAASLHHRVVLLCGRARRSRRPSLARRDRHEAVSLRRPLSGSPGRAIRRAPSLRESPAGSSRLPAGERHPSVVAFARRRRDIASASAGASSRASTTACPSRNH